MLKNILQNANNIANINIRDRGKPRDKYSIDNLSYLYQVLVNHQTVSHSSKPKLIETIREIGEIMIWGDQHDSAFFDLFAEIGVLAQFARLVNQKFDHGVKTQVIQTLSILIMNVESEQSMFFLLSNNFINDLICYPFDFSDEELLSHYISLLKTLSFKLTNKTVLFFFNEKARDFPLYIEALKFFNHPEGMVRIAVRTLTLNIYKISDPSLRKFLINKSSIPYFTNLIWYCKDQTLILSRMIESTSSAQTANIEETIEKVVDLYYYFQDILNCGIEQMSTILTDQLLALYILPMLIGSLASRYTKRDEKEKTQQTASPPPPPLGSILGLIPSPPNRDFTIQARLSLFLLSQLFIVFQHVGLINATIVSLLHPKLPIVCDALVRSPIKDPYRSRIPLIGLLYPKSLKNLAENGKDAGSRRDSRADRADVPLNPEKAKEVKYMEDNLLANINSTHDTSPPNSPLPEDSRTFPRAITKSSSDSNIPNGDSASSSSSEPTNGLAPVGEDGNQEFTPTHRKRSPLPIMKVFWDPVKQLPKYDQRADVSRHRQAMMLALQSQDERVAFSAMGLLYTIMRNEVSDSNLLMTCALCPQVLKKADKILADLTASEVSTPEKTSIGSKSASKSGVADILGLGFMVDEPPPSRPALFSSTSALHSTPYSSRISVQTDPELVDMEVAYHTPRSSGISLDSEIAPPVADILGLSGLSSRQSSNSPIPSSSNNSNCPSPTNGTKSMSGAAPVYSYSPEFVQRLLSHGNRSVAPRLVTLQLMFEVVKELVYHPSNTNCLSPEHFDLLRKSGVKLANDCKDLIGKIVETPTSDENKSPSDLVGYLLDIVDLEVAQLAQVVYAKVLATNSRNLMPIYETVIASVGLEWRKPANDFERLRKALQCFLLCRQFRFRFSHKHDKLSPLCSQITTKIGDVLPLESSQGVCTALHAPGKQLHFIMDTDVLVLLSQKESDANEGVVECVIPLAYQIPYSNRNNPSLLQITLRSSSKPHSCARRVKNVTTEAPLSPLWSISLLFSDTASGISLRKSMENHRLHLRKLMLIRLYKSFEQTEEIDKDTWKNVTATTATSAPLQAIVLPNDRTSGVDEEE